MILSTKSVLTAGAILLLPLHILFSEPPAKELPSGEGPPTVIDSDHLKMTTLEEETRFVFSNNVKVTTTDMTVYCDRLEVYAGREDTSAEGDESDLGRIRRIFAIGNVRITQEDREATSGRAEVFPQEGRIVLTENPVLRNEQGRVSGEEIIFYQGESEAVVNSSPTQPARVVLPTIPALGSKAGKRAKDEAPARENEQPD